MSIFINKDTKVIVQGITGSQGRFYALRNRAYGTQVVGGVSPKKAGEDVEGIPVFASAKEAKEATGATASMILVPAPFAKDAVLEAADAGIELIIPLTEGIPAQDEASFYNQVKRSQPGSRILGPNCPGLVTVGEANIGFIPAEVEIPGNVGIVSRSGTLTYQALKELAEKGIGVSTCVGIGGDPVPGTSFIDCLSAFEKDPDTKAVIMFGEIGGSAEEEAAQFLKDEAKRGRKKPMVGFIAGRTAPPGRRMGHAGAIISGGKGGAEDKIAAMEAAGIRVSPSPARLGSTLVEVLKG